MLSLFKNKWVLLGLMALTWGSSFFFIKRSLLEFSPFQIGAFRVGMSGIALAVVGIPALRKMNMKTILWIAIAGLFGIFLPMFLFPIAQTRVSSSLAGMINALEPIFVLVLGVLIFGARNRWIQYLGAFIGLVGAAILLYFSESSGEENNLSFTLLMVLASACYGLSSLIIERKLKHVPSLSVSSGLFTIWMVPSLLILLFSGFFTETQWTTSTFQALGYLSILTFLGTTIAMVLFYKLIQNTSAMFASTVSYLIPVVAVVWGVLDGEKFVIWYLLGGMLILLGIYFIREKN